MTNPSSTTMPLSSDFNVPDRPPRRDWIIWGVVAVLGTVLFWVSGLDLDIQHLYFAAGESDPWPQKHLPIWRFFYQASWVLAGGLALGGVAMVLLARLKLLPLHWSARGWTVVLVVALGCGVVVNMVFKDHYGRQRPRDVVEFGGVHAYQPPLLPGVQGTGKSFPCGHASAAFALFAFFFIWRRSRPRLAGAAMLTAIVLGCLFGVGRISAGAHYASDVLWCGLMMYAVSWVVYYKLVNVPRAEAELEASGTLPAMTRTQKVGLVVCSVAVVVGALLAKPINHNSSYKLAAGALDGTQRFDIDIDYGRVRIDFVEQADVLRIDARTQGFGWPENKILRDIDQVGQTLTYQYRHQGWYTEKGTELKIEISSDLANRLNLKLGEGDVFASQDPSGLIGAITVGNGVVNY